jgi:hypothetical protein
MAAKWIKFRRGWYRTRAAFGRWYAKGQLTSTRTSW